LRPTSRLGTGLVLAGVLPLLGGIPARAGPPHGETILPPVGHAAGEARALAEAHGPQLRALADGLARCAPALTVDRHGIGFRRPQARPGAAPHLTLWAWLPADAPPPGRDPATRAGEAFRRYGRVLFRHLLARGAVLTDDRVGGYGLVLSWLGPASRGGRPIAESLVLFADKVAGANLALDTIGPGVFLDRATVRLFEGQTELSGVRPTIDGDGPPVAEPC